MRLRRKGHAYQEIEELLLRVKRKGLCLDLPSGKGVNYEGIRAAGFTPVGVDLVPRNASSVDAPQVKANFLDRLPFQDQSFAAVLCSEGIEHHPAQSDLIREFRRVLEPGGGLLITTPNTLNLRARLSTALNGHYTFRRAPISEKTQLWPGPDGTRSLVGHAHMVDYFELRFILKTNGFEIVKVATAKYSAGSLALSPLLWLPVRHATKRLLRRYLREHPDVYRELMRDGLSNKVLFGKKLIVLARRELHETPRERVRPVPLGSQRPGARPPTRAGSVR